MEKSSKIALTIDDLKSVNEGILPKKVEEIYGISSLDTLKKVIVAKEYEISKTETGSLDMIY